MRDYNNIINRYFKIVLSITKYYKIIVLFFKKKDNDLFKQQSERILTCLTSTHISLCELDTSMYIHDCEFNL